MAGAARTVRIMRISTAVAAALACVAAAAAATPVVVDTPLGKLTGVRSGGVDAFKGIKYGTIAHRFAVAEAAPVWGAAGFSATSFGDYCVQQFQYPNQTMSEDCLHLNVWRPQDANENSALAVMFWIHGGGFTGGAGSAPKFNGAYMAKTQNVVVVTINYRLGPIGFLMQDSSGTGGLNGISDQALALQWTHDNIGSLGGDVGRVTVFGESAGSLSTCYLAVSPLASGLMRNAILESGACTGAAWGASTDAAGSFKYTEWFAKTVLGAPSIEALQDPEAFPASTLVWPGTDAHPPHGAVPYRVAVDYGRVLPKAQRDLYMEGSLNVDGMIIGGNSYDGLAPWTWGTPAQSTVFPPPSNYPLLMAYIYGSRAQAVTKAYALSKYDGQTRYAVTAGNGDHDVVCPAKTLASVVARWLPNSTYFYVFAHLYGLDKAAAVGMIDTDTAPSTWASHTAEIPFVFHQQTDVVTIYENVSKTVPFTAEENTLSHSMQEYWTTFAKEGKPTSATATAAGSTPWQPASSATPPSQTTKISGMRKFTVDEIATIDEWRDDGCAAFDEVWSTGGSGSGGGSSSGSGSGHGGGGSGSRASGSDSNSGTADGSGSDSKDTGSNPTMLIVIAVGAGIVVVGVLLLTRRRTGSGDQYAEMGDEQRA